MVDVVHHLKADKEMIVNGCRTAGISEAITNGQTITEKVENPFKELWFFYWKHCIAKTENEKVFL